jgi:hypothetical protein
MRTNLATFWLSLRYQIMQNAIYISMCGRRRMMPQWQCYPVIPAFESPFNWDWLSLETPDPYYASIDNAKVIIGEGYMLPDP